MAKATARTVVTPTLAEYRALGLVRLTRGGPWTHPDGDEVAEQILDGTIPREQAIRWAEQRHRQEQQITNARRPRRYTSTTSGGRPCL